MVSIFWRLEIAKCILIGNKTKFYVNDRYKPCFLLINHLMISGGYGI